MASNSTPNYKFLLLIVPLFFSFAVFTISNKYYTYNEEVSIDYDMNSEQIKNLISDAKNDWSRLRRFLPELQTSGCPFESFLPLGNILLKF